MTDATTPNDASTALKQLSDRMIIENAAAKLAVIGQLSVEEAKEILTTTIKLFDIKPEEVDEVIDKLNSIDM